MVWYGIYHLVWYIARNLYGMVWYGMVWHTTYHITWYSMVLIIRYGIVRYGTYHIAWYSMALIWYGMVLIM